MPTQPDMSDPYELEDDFADFSSPLYDEPVVDDAVDA